MATIYGLDYRVRLLESKVKGLYCYLKDNGGGGPETDPVFRASPAFTITQADKDRWNAGGSGGNYVPMDGMNLFAGEHMKESFLLANYDMINEQPPDDSIAVGMSQLLGGFVYQGTTKNNSNAFNSSINAGPSAIAFNSTLNSTINGNYYTNFTLNGSQANISNSGQSPDGNYSATGQITSAVNVLNKSSRVSLENSGFDGSTGNNFYYSLDITSQGVRLGNLTDAQGDPSYTKQIVARPDGYIGLEDKPSSSDDPITQILGSINAQNVPTGITTSGTVFKKGSTFTVHLRDTGIQRNASRDVYQYFGDITQYGIKCPFEVMFPCTVTVVDTNNNATYIASTGVVYQNQIYVYLPKEALVTTTFVGIIAYFQFTNTNTSP